MPSASHIQSNAWRLPILVAFVVGCVTLLVALSGPQTLVDVAYNVHVDQPLAADFVKSLVAAEVVAPLRSKTAINHDATRVQITYAGGDAEQARVAWRTAKRLADAFRPAKLTESERAERLYLINARLADLRHQVGDPTRKQEAVARSLEAEQARLLGGLPLVARVEQIRNAERPSNLLPLLLAPALAAVVLAASFGRLVNRQRSAKLGGPVETSQALRLPTVLVTARRNWRAA